MCGLDVRIASAEAKFSDGKAYDISGYIAFSGAATGGVTLCFQMEPAVRIAGAFSRSATELSPEALADPIGELANIIAGGAKAQLTGQMVSIAIPKITRRRHYITGATRTAPHIVLPCDTNVGGFDVDIFMAMKKPHASLAAGPRK